MGNVISLEGWRAKKVQSKQGSADLACLHCSVTTQQTDKYKWPNSDSCLYIKVFLGSVFLGSACALIWFAISAESVYMVMAGIFALSAYVAYAMGTDGMGLESSSLSQYASLCRKSNPNGTGN